VWSWTSDRFGFGTLTFTTREKPRLLRYDRVQGAIGVEFRGEILLVPDHTGTRVTWHEWARLAPNPNLRLVSTELIEENFLHALEGLKRLAEEPPQHQ